MSNTGTVKQIIFTEKVYKKNPWFVPIEKKGDRFMTGQDLSYDKMTGKTPLTEEEREKYPYVINPTNVYQTRNFAKFDVDDPYEASMYNLIIASMRIAPSQPAYKENPKRYDGYFSDKEMEAIADNDLEDQIYEATTLIRNSPIDHYQRIATILNYMVKGNFYIPVKTSSENTLKYKLLKACREYPKEVQQCFSKHNPGIENYIFILELVEYDIIRETPRGEFFYQSQLIGDSIENSISTLAKRDGYELKQILSKKLGSAKMGIREKDVVTPDQFKQDVANLKAFLFDNKTDRFVAGMANLYRKYPSFCKSHEYADDMDLLERKLDEVQNPQPDEPLEKEEPKVVKENKPEPPKKEPVKKSEKQKYIDSLEGVEAEKLQNKIKHNRTPFDPEACKDFWEDADKLREYMVSVKFPVDAE